MDAHRAQGYLMPPAFTPVTGQYAAGGATAGTTVVVTLPSAPTAGNLVALEILYYSGGASGTTISGIVDNNGNAYTVTPNSPSTYDAGAGQIFQAYRLVAPANAHQTITVTFNNTIGVAAVWAREFSYTGGPIALDGDNKGDGQPRIYGNGSEVAGKYVQIEVDIPQPVTVGLNLELY
jgi:hypothetical protein